MKSKIVTIKSIKTKPRIFLPIAVLLLFLAVIGNANGGEPIKSGADTPQEAIDIAVSYQSIFDGIYADGFTSLSDDTVLEIENKVSNMGYAVTDALGAYDFKNPQIVTDFFSQLEASPTAQMTIIEICYDGGLIKSDIFVDSDKRTVTTTRVSWKESEPIVTYKTENNLLDLRYTDEGSLIYKQNIPNNTGSNHDGYIEPTTIIKIAPLDAKCREYCKKYISAIAYDRNNLFLTDWTSDDMREVALNDLFPKLYQIAYNKTLA